MIVKELPEKCDVLVIGSGAAGCTFALAAKVMNPNLKVHIVERTDSAGGCTVYSGGGCWMPGHEWMEDPSKDSEAARTYLKNMYPEIDEACLDGFLADVPNVMELYKSNNVEFEKSLGYPDYYQELEGASKERTIFPLVYKGSKQIRNILRKTPWYYVPFTFNEFLSWGTHRIDRWNKTLLAKRKLLGHVVLGKAMIGFLLEACMNAGVDITLNSNVDEILVQNGQFMGAVVNEKQVSASIGMIAAGGFSHHPELMKKISAVRPMLSVSPEECDSGGGGLKLELDAGLKVNNPYCWWSPCFKTYDERVEEKPGPDLWAYHSTMLDRAWPGGIMVNAEGKRFTNESACYNTVGKILAEDPDPALDNVWLIWGDYYVRNYIRGIVSYYQPAKSYMNKSRTVEELAEKTGLPVENLRETIDHWNEMAKEGKDYDFGRGESEYDRFMGDGFRDGHPNIGPVEPPFQAVRMEPGTIGTKMGAVIDPHGRVSTQNDETVSGLYAAGNAKAAIFGDYYPGAGATLGQAIVFAYRAAKHASGKADS